MDSRIAIGDKLELEKVESRLSMNPDKVPVIYASHVLDEAENGNVLVSMPIQEGNIIPLSVGQEFSATFYSKTGLLQCQVMIIGRFKKDTLFLMEIEQMTPLQKIQRREYFRLDCNMPVEYRVVTDQERKLIDEGIAYNIDEVQWKNGVILDLSGGGIRFVSPYQEEKDGFIQLRFDISAGDNIEVVYAYASVLRSERNQNNAAIYDNHLMFWKMDKGMREKIIRFIFDIQRKSRSKENGLS